MSETVLRTGSEAVAVVHPGVQHSALTAQALLTQGIRAELWTSAQFGARAAETVWSRPLEHLVARGVTSLDDSFIRRRLLAGALTSRLASRLGFGGLASSISRVHSAAFQLIVARSLKAVGVVVGSDGESYHLFGHVPATVRRMLDVAHPTPGFVREATLADSDRHGFDLPAYDDFPIVRNWERALELKNREAELAEFVVVASQFSRQCLLRDGFPRDKISVVPYGFELPQLTRHGPQRNPGDELRLLFVGALSERKGVSLLLRAMKRLPRRARVTLTIVGRQASGWSPPSLPEGVTVVGAISHRQLEQEWIRSHALVLPSICEGFGRVLVEALARGLGVVTTERSAGPDIAAACPSAAVEIVLADRREVLDEVILGLFDSQWPAIDSRALLEVQHNYSLEAYGARLMNVIGV